MTSSDRTVAIIGTRGYPSYYGGFETAVRHLAPFMADRGWKVRVYSRPGQVRADDSDRDYRVSIVYTWGLDSTSLSTLTYGLFSVIHALLNKPQVALVMNVANGFWLPLLRLRGVRTVVNVDGIEWHREKWSRFGKFVFKLGAWFTAKFADELVFDAEAIGDYWRRTFGRDGTYIPYGGVPVTALDCPEGMDSGSYALAVARFVPENTIAEFLEASRELANFHPVVIVGSAPEGTPLYNAAAELAAEAPAVTWLGHVSDDRLLYSLWQHAGVYFHGHSVGGTNPALVQAMAIGVPVVARDTVYNREVLADAGHFVDANVAQIRSALSDVLADGSRGRLMADAARDRALNRYTWDDVCASYVDLLDGSHEK